MKILTFLLLLVFSAGSHMDAASKNAHATFSHVPKKTLQRLQPYLIPHTHPALHSLDTLFQSERVTLNQETLAAAGFCTLYNQPRSFLRIVSHPELPGYLLKLSLDTTLALKRGKSDWEWFIRRCEGAKMLKKILTRMKLTHFVVPDKWIYILPPSSAPFRDASHDPKIAVLLVSNMDLVSKEENLNFWSSRVTKKFLRSLYDVLSFCPPITVRPDNIWLTRSGHVAFIDTEYKHAKKNLQTIKKYLSADMAAYWDKLILEGSH